MFERLFFSLCSLKLSKMKESSLLTQGPLQEHTMHWICKLVWCVLCLFTSIPMV